MKKVIIGISFILFGIFTVVGQNNRDQIKALKTAFITNALELTPSEAEKFWPVYNGFDQRIQEVRNRKTQQLARKIRLAGGLKNLSDIEADAILKEYINIDYNVALEKRKLHKNLTGIISSKKIIKLLRAEQDFTKELLRKLRDRRANKSIKRN